MNAQQESLTNILVSLVVVGSLFLLGMLGAVSGWGWVFGVVLPYLAVAMFAGGMIYRVMSWANVPVPFRIPTTCGQEKSLPWIKQAKLDNPNNTLTVIGRMALEVLCFRSLLRNTKTKLENGRVVYATDLWLWLGAMAMHWTLLLILIRHLRLMTAPVPFFVTFLEGVDGFLEVDLPVIYVTSVVFLAAVAYLLFRRLAVPQVRYISLASDYFPLFLLLGIGLSGFFLRHVAKTNLVDVKELALALVTFNFGSVVEHKVLGSINGLFFGHLFLVCVLLGYFPFSKLCHMGGVFLSPTRNLANNNRRVRHVNPWDYPVKTHPYGDYEDEWREKMKGAGVPVEKE